MNPVWATMRWNGRTDVPSIFQGRTSVSNVSTSAHDRSWLSVSAIWCDWMIVGFAIGLGGAGVTALGWVADRWGVATALWISALTPLVAFALTRLLPAPRDAAA